ncbi:MipA/OmpV family protein [Rhodospirillaceae bacterium KN72]|uniref:MipA/OmpV family protein n=1 Tax=Pacificispira spongiicola TaxID=2729598 RepID=A0A7Y0HFR0_9PROT|nr:MipA/OmpV family protein [Pacificispira spongiicola]NMM46100.1 MipA/OmpV family protein [Pacificispira spongiicola]
MKKTIIVLLGGLASAFSAAAKAEDDSGFSFSLGAAARYSPDYEGSDDYEAMALPMMSVDWKAKRSDLGDGETDASVGLLDASLSFPKGLDVTFADIRGPLGAVEFSTGLGYEFGRDAGDNDALTGMGDIDGFVVGKFGALVKSRIGLFAGADLNQSLSDDDNGYTVETKLGMQMPVSDSIVLIPQVSAVWASDDHMQQFFGVSGSQAASSGYTRYTPDSGFKTVGVGVSANWGITENWSLIGNVGVDRLIGDAADSPLVDGPGNATQPSLFLGGSYKF